MAQKQANKQNKLCMLLEANVHCRDKTGFKRCKQIFSNVCFESSLEQNMA